MTKNGVLPEILRQIEGASFPKLCVFDLDSTLICVKGRTKKILQSVAHYPRFQHICSPYIEHFKKAEFDEKAYSLKSILQNMGVSLNFDCYKEVFLYWTLHFFSNKYLEHDKLYKGVKDFLFKVQKSGSDIMYLTGRSFSLMGTGTFSQIQKWKLPLEKRNHLIMKPNTFTEDAYYKVKQLEELSKTYSNIWFFENEPVIINFVNKLLPHISIVFVNTAHSGRQNLRKKFQSINGDYSL